MSLCLWYLRGVRFLRQNFQPRIHFTESDYMILTRDGSVCDTAGKLGRAEFEACMREQINFYAQRKLSDCLLNETFSDSKAAEISAIKVMLHELLRLSDDGRMKIGGKCDCKAAIQLELQGVRTDLNHIISILRQGDGGSEREPALTGVSEIPQVTSYSAQLVGSLGQLPPLTETQNAVSPVPVIATAQRDIKSILCNGRVGAFPANTQVGASVNVIQLHSCEDSNNCRVLPHYMPAAGVLSTVSAQAAAQKQATSGQESICCDPSFEILQNQRKSPLQATEVVEAKGSPGTGDHQGHRYKLSSETERIAAGEDACDACVQRKFDTQFIPLQLRATPPLCPTAIHSTSSTTLPLKISRNIGAGRGCDSCCNDSRIGVLGECDTSVPLE